MPTRSIHRVSPPMLEAYRSPEYSLRELYSFDWELGYSRRVRQLQPSVRRQVSQDIDTVVFVVLNCHSSEIRKAAMLLSITAY
jgi:hypothetical protein